MIKINCENCGKCCFSEIPKSSFLKDKVFFDEIEDPTSRDSISNKVVLLGREIKNFYDYGFGYFLKFSMIAGNDKKTEGIVILKTLPKFIDGRWFMTCSFFDPKIKKCRIYNTLLYPTACKIYPFNLLIKEIDPLCEPSKIPNLLQNEMIKIKQNDLKLNSSESTMEIEEDLATFKERCRKDPYKIVISLLYNSFGEPTHLDNNFKWIFKEVQKEDEYHKKNFK